MTRTGWERARFSEFELDLQSGEMWDPAGRRVLLPQQPLRTLVALLRAQGNIVTREELRRELWPDDTFVDYEHGINAVVKRLREAIGDSATAPRFIETIPRVGYRLIVPATFVERAGMPGLPPTAEPAPAGSDPHHHDLPAWRGHWPGIPPKATVGAIVVVTVVVAIAAAFKSRAGVPAQRQPGRTLHRLTSSAGLNVDPALSPDGSLLAYASDRGGTTGMDIWVQPVAGGAPRRLTSDEGDEVEPSFSPDGESIFYSRREIGGIYRIDVVSGTSRLVIAVSRARTPRVSADGRWVLYWTGQQVWTAGAARTPPGATSALAVVPAAGGTPTTLATNLATARYGVWSPDGERILFLGEEREGQMDWYVISRQGGQPRRTGAIDVIRAAGIAGAPIPGEWSRTQNVVFAAAAGETSNVWELPISPESMSVSGPLTRLTFGSAEERSPVGSRPGRIAFASIVENVDVWRLPLDERYAVGRRPMERVTEDAAVDQMMNVTRDAASMVFISARTKTNEAWLRNLITGSERRLTFNGAEFARIHPDGSRVAIRRPGPASLAELVPAREGAAERLCDDCQVDDWSPDGSKLVVERGHPRALFVRDVATGRERTLASHPEWNLFRARFSPDGRWVVFHTTNSATLRQIYAVPASGSPALDVTGWIPIVTDFGIQPGWAADGRGIYHFSLRDGSFCAWLQPIDPASAKPVGAPRAVQHLHEPGLRAASGAVVSNDVRGNHLYVTLTETKGNIWMLRD